MIRKVTSLKTSIPSEHHEYEKVVRARNILGREPILVLHMREEERVEILLLMRRPSPNQTKQLYPTIWWHLHPCLQFDSTYILVSILTTFVAKFITLNLFDNMTSNFGNNQIHNFKNVLKTNSFFRSFSINKLIHFSSFQFTYPMVIFT